MPPAYNRSPIVDKRCPRSVWSRESPASPIKAPGHGQSDRRTDVAQDTEKPWPLQPQLDEALRQVEPDYETRSQWEARMTARVWEADEAMARWARERGE